MKSLIAASLLVFSSVSFASIVTIDFNDVTDITSYPSGANGFQTQGFQFFTAYGAALYDRGDGDLAALGVSVEYGGPTAIGFVFMRRLDGEAFALWDAEVWDFSGVSLDIYGQTSSGEGIYTNDLTEFGSGDWLSVVDVIFEAPGGPFSPVFVDNVVVGSAVSVPAAVWLFASGLGVLGWLRRSQ